MRKYAGHFGTEHKFTRITPAAARLVYENQAEETGNFLSNGVMVSEALRFLEEKIEFIREGLSNLINPVLLPGNTGTLRYTPTLGLDTGSLLNNLNGKTPLAKFLKLHAVLNNDDEALKEYNTIFDFEYDVPLAAERKDILEKVSKIAEYGRIFILIGAPTVEKTVFNFTHDEADHPYRYARNVTGEVTIFADKSRKPAFTIDLPISREVNVKKDFDFDELKYYKPAVEILYEQARCGIEWYNFGVEKNWDVRGTYFYNTYATGIALAMTSLLNSYKEFHKHLLKSGATVESSDSSEMYYYRYGNVYDVVRDLIGDIDHSGLKEFITARNTYDFSDGLRSGYSDIVKPYQALRKSSFSIMATRPGVPELSITKGMNTIVLTMADLFIITATGSISGENKTEVAIDYFHKFDSLVHGYYLEIVLQHLQTNLVQAAVDFKEAVEKFKTTYPPVDPDYIQSA